MRAVPRYASPVPLALARAPRERREAPRVALEQRETLQREQRLARRPQETGLLQRRAQSAPRAVSGTLPNSLFERSPY